MRRAGSPRRRRARGVLLALLLPALGACATEWKPHATPAAAPLQWPFSPLPAKLKLLRTLDGFAASASVGSAMHRLVYGQNRRDGSAFVLPVAVAAAADGRIAVADLGQACVHLYVPAERRYLRLVGTDRAPLVSPVGLAFDGDGNLYVTDSAAGLFAYDAQGKLRFHLDRSSDWPQRPTGIAYDPQSRRLYVVDTGDSRVLVLDGAGKLLFTFGARGEGAGQLNFPTHAFWSAATRELFVTDAMNFRVAIFDPDGHPRGTFGRHGDGSGDMAMPKGIAVDGDGVVYVADGLFDNVQLFDRQGQFLLTLGGRGTEPGELWLPTGLFVSKSGELYVCDTYNHRIQVFGITAGYQPSE